MDKLPITPSRLKWPLLIARLCAGAFVGSVLATQNFQIKEYGYYGALIGLSGALLGALIGYMLRTRLVTHFHLPDYGVALAEDCIAIAGSIGVVAWAMNYVVVC